MATEGNAAPVNGNYAPHQGYAGLEQQGNYTYGGNSNAATSQTASNSQPPTSSTPAAGVAQTDIPKDEVGWYFVEQYYTTLSRNPERLYLFFNKRSQFVSGQETDKVPVCLGQRAINERIKELDYQDCKVRVTNVDSQASDTNIVIQVIGEISNKSQPHKKFAQTFVLAPQNNGYFVLNDIFRYLMDEEEEAEVETEPTLEATGNTHTNEAGYQEPPPTAANVENKTMTSSADPVAVEHDAKQVDKQIEEKALPEQTVEVEVEKPTVNGASEEDDDDVKHAEDAPEAVEAEPAAPELEETTKEEPEQPKEPERIPSPPKEAAPQPAPVPKPSAPKTWASMAAGANRVATPAAPAPAPSSTPQSRPTPPAEKTSTPPALTPSSAAPPTAPSGPAVQRDESPADAGQAEEWTPVGGGHNRQQSRQTNTQQQDGPVTRGYIKNVHENIEYDDLKSHLARYGEVVYFDIGRQKNAAYVEFKYPDGYASAIAANPHTVGGDRLYVEERRPFVPRGNYQGSRGRGSGVNQGQQRGNFQGRGGNNYTPRGGRGNATQTRGRGGSSQAA